MQIKEKWDNLDPKIRRWVKVGSIGSAIVIFFWVLMPDGNSYKNKREKMVEHILTSKDTDAVTLQGLAAKMDSSRSNEKKLQRQIDQLEAKVREFTGNARPEKTVQKELSQMRSKLESAERKADLANEKLKEYEETGFPGGGNINYTGQSRQDQNSSGQGGLIPIIPSMATLEDSSSNQDMQNGEDGDLRDQNKGQQESTLQLYANAEEFFQNAQTSNAENSDSRIGQNDSSSFAAKPIAIRSISSDDTNNGTVAKKARAVQRIRQETSPPDKEDDGIYIPAGSMIEAVIIAGMDAPTANSAKSDPFPALMRFKKEAILPNRFKADIRECFLITSGYGSMSSERAYLRGETVSCITEDGEAFEADFDSFAVGPDGKVGVRGRLVTKAGALVGRAMLAGFGQGLSEAFRAAPVPTISTSDSGDIQYQDVYSEQALQSASLSGVGTALEKVADYYLDMAEELTPVIEIDAGRIVTFVVNRGLTLKMKKKLTD